MIREIIYLFVIFVFGFVGYRYYIKIKKRMGLKFNKGLKKGKYVIIRRNKERGLLTIPEWKNARAFYKDHLGYEE